MRFSRLNESTEGARIGIASRMDRRSVAICYAVRHKGIDYSILGHENAVMFYRTSAVEYLLGDFAP
jgi:hypothetical protein